MKRSACFIAMSVLMASFITCQEVYSAANYSYTAPQTYNNVQNNSLQGRVIYVPAGAVTSVMLSNELNSETAMVGSSISATLTDDFIYKNQLVAQKGSVINGTIVKAKKAGIANRNGQIQVIFNSITTPQGYNIPVNAVFKTADNTGILKGGTKKDAAIEYTKDAVLGAGAGAALGTAMGALSSGSVGKGAIYGTAIGGGLGLAKAVANKGDNFSIPASSCLDVYFTQPITLSAPEEYKYKEDFNYEQAPAVQQENSYQGEYRYDY